MRKVLGLSLAFLLGSGLGFSSQAVTLEKGWNLKGADCSVDFENINNPDIRLVWKYENGNWELFTQNEKIREIAQSLGIKIFTKTNPSDGFWILTDNSTTVDLCGEEETSEAVPAPALQHSSDSLFRVLEGDFDTVLQNLGNKTEKTDEEKIAYALALLGKTAQTGVLNDAGIYVIPGYGHVFGLEVDDDEYICNSTKYVNDTKNLINAIDKSLEELDTVSSNVTIEIPQSYLNDDVSANVDNVTVDTLKALLIGSKAGLEYLLAYDWSKIGELCSSEKNNNTFDTLSYLEVLNVSDPTYLDKAKSDLDSALKKLEDTSTQEVPNMDKETYSKSLLTWALMDEDENFSNRGELENLGTNTIAKLIDSLENGLTEVSNANRTYTYEINLKYIFDNPIDGNRIKEDVEEHKIIEQEVCNAGWEICDGSGNCEKHCTDTDEEIWFTKNSYIYNYITSISPNATLYERSLNGTTYYTIDENEYWSWNIQE